MLQMNSISLLSFKPKASNTKKILPRSLTGKHPCVNAVGKGKVYLDPTYSSEKKKS